MFNLISGAGYMFGDMPDGAKLPLWMLVMTLLRHQYLHLFVPRIS